jgi:K+-transporting ATPase KdpF subunit
MSALDVVALVLVVGLGAYLVVALLKPEKFQ